MEVAELPGDLNRAQKLAAASRSLGDFVARDPAAAALLSRPLAARDELARVIAKVARAEGEAGVRVEKRRRLAHIAAFDLSGELSLTEVGEALSDLADSCLRAVVGTVPGGEALGVIGLGKLGGRELNYVSDIDLMFVTDSDLAKATVVAETVVRVLGEFSPAGRAYEIDLDLRPEGRSGAIVRTLKGCREYYERWAQSWEFQALIKARAIAGGAVGDAFIHMVTPLVYPPDVDPERVAAVRAMKERVETNAARLARRARGADQDNVKLGPGGIRDIEFSVQLLQLVHGGSDDSVRDGSTLRAIDALIQGGYLAEEDGTCLRVAYEWLRTVEHRLQLGSERRTHTIPQRAEDRARFARLLGFRDTADEGAADRFDKHHRAILIDVRSRFEKLFYRPMVESLAGGGVHRLSSEALKERLRVLGFRDVDRAARTLSGLVSGTSRRARIFRVVTPALLRWLASAPMPDEGLFSFLRLSESLANRVDLLGGLRDNPPALALLARVLGSGPLLGEVLAHVPEELSSLAAESDDLRTGSRDRVTREARASLEWREPEARLDGLRRFKRRLFVEIAVADIRGRIDADGVGRSLTHLADACLAAALDDVEFPFAVIGMGKLGGCELNYASDIDVMFVHGGEPMEAERLAEDLLAAIGEVTPEGQAFRIDTQIRPEGKNGPLTRSLESFVEYYERWGSTWEHQSLLKARVCAGDEELGNALIAATRKWAWPAALTQEARAEVRHLKTRMEKERIPRGTDPRRNFKLGPGGMSDLEFAIQLVQMSYVHEHPLLRTVSTVDAIEGARKADLLAPDEAAELTTAYGFLASLRNRLFLIFGRPVDALPVQPERMEALGIAMGYRQAPRQELEEDFLRLTRRTRRLTERLIFGR
jgi:[glutamine synthetase] adenylyltransferase / [glutamine synthetase]-adenylyl-L-tyrosine phosphorylase